MSHLPTNVIAALQFAIRQEQRSADLYQHLADQCEDAKTHQTYRDCAEEERRHEQILKGFLGRGGMRPDAKIDDMLTDLNVPAAVDFNTDMNRNEILAIAIQREAAAKRLYLNLAAIARDPKLRLTLEALAEEEGSHETNLVKMLSAKV